MLWIKYEDAENYLYIDGNRLLQNALSVFLGRIQLQGTMLRRFGVFQLRHSFGFPSAFRPC